MPRAAVLVSFGTHLRLKPWPIDRARLVMTDLMKRCDLCLPICDDGAAITRPGTR
jgi:2-dehydro-3-deoxygluconokinase